MRSLAAVLLVLATAGPAAAHISLTYPTPRTASLKAGPCGADGSTRGSNVTVLAPGATIDVTWTETINHPGHYRISFDDAGQDFTVPLSFDDTTQNTNVLVDNIADSSAPSAHYTQSITLPSIECETCTLQVIQMMTDKPPYGDGNDIYFQCADLALRKDAGTGSCSGGGDAGVEPPSPGGGCSAGGSSLVCAVLVVPLVIARRRRARA